MVHFKLQIKIPNKQNIPLGEPLEIEKSGGVAEGHDVGFLLYSGERPQGARRSIILYFSCRVLLNIF